MTTRKDILQLLAEGRITVDDATEMLGALHGFASAESEERPVVEDARPAEPAPQKAKNGRHWLHIHVSDLQSGKGRVRVNVPLGMVHFGLKLGARFTDEADSEMIHDVLAALSNEDMVGTLVEVEDMDDNERVQLFVD